MAADDRGGPDSNRMRTYDPQALTLTPLRVMTRRWVIKLTLPRTDHWGPT